MCECVSVFDLDISNHFVRISMKEQTLCDRLPKEYPTHTNTHAEKDRQKGNIRTRVEFRKAIEERGRSSLQRRGERRLGEQEGQREAWDPVSCVWGQEELAPRAVRA